MTYNIKEWIVNNVKGDKRLWSIFTLWCFLSIIFVYGATSLGNKNDFHEVVKQIFVVAGGFLLAIIFHKISPKILRNFSLFFYLLSLVLVLSVFLFGVSKGGGDAKRWIDLGFITFQPSDIAKIAMVLFLANMVSRLNNKTHDVKSILGYFILPILCIVIPISVSNGSTGLVIFIVSLIIIIVGGFPLKYIKILVITALGIFGSIILVEKLSPNSTRVGTWQGRFSRHFTADPSDPHSQSNQSIGAIAMGGISPKGPGGSQMKYVIHSPHADFMFAIITEEYSIIFSIFLLFTYFAFFYQCVQLVLKSENSFASLYAIGFGTLVMLHAIIHIYVCLSILPVTGIALPFVSKGGTSFWMLCVGFGILMNFSKSVEFDNLKSKTIATA
jgi:cell division protein FtsW